ncbi:hypothetical protein BBP40_006450, partial [Aspergillus hancockii]
MSSTTIHPTKPTLTTNDSSVLQALFDAESSPSNAITITNTLPPFPTIPKDLYETIQTRELAIVRTLNQPNTTPETIQAAIQDLISLIKDHPTYPPAYVNRAQALRILIDPTTAESSDPDTTASTTLFAAENEETFANLLSDLGEAITLSTPRSPADPVSPVQARVLADAHTHRGYLLLRLAK